LALPCPDRQTSKGWAFDAKAGQREILYRRVGQNELDAIQICNGYVEAQQEYALAPRQGYDVNQYAQRIIASPASRTALLGRMRMAPGMVRSERM